MKTAVILTLLLQVVPMSQINGKSESIQIKAWRWTGDEPLSEPPMA